LFRRISVSLVLTQWKTHKCDFTLANALAENDTSVNPYKLILISFIIQWINGGIGGQGWQESLKELSWQQIEHYLDSTLQVKVENLYVIFDYLVRPICLSTFIP